MDIFFDTYLIPLHVALTLCAVSFVTSVISGIFGMVGGVILIVVGTFLLPLDVFLPIHACIQCISNLSRVFMGWHHLDKQVWRQFTIANAVGTFLGTYVVVFLSRPVITLISSIFIILGTWFKMFTFNFRFGLYVLGKIHGFIGGMVGATGPFAMPTLIHRYGHAKDYDRIIITNSALNANGHTVRAIAFAVWGYAYDAVWELIAVMAVFSILGSWVGTKMRHKITSKDSFIFALKILITGLATINVIKAFW